MSRPWRSDSSPNVQIDADNKLFVSYSELSFGFPQDELIVLYDKHITENMKEYTVIEIPLSDLPAFPSLAGAAETTAAETTAGETTVAETTAAS